MNAVVELLAHYLRADEVEQRALVSRYPTLFTCDIRAALVAARRQLDMSMEEARAACEAVDDATAPLRALPEHDAAIALDADERRQMTDEVCMVDRFAASLAELLGQLAGRQWQSPSLTEAAETVTDETGDTHSHTPWHQDADVVLRVLSFLSLDEVLTSAEDVCAAWRHWLFVPATSSLFWREGIQREYPQFWHALVGDDDDDEAVAQSVRETDWRSIAMLCVSSGELL